MVNYKKVIFEHPLAFRGEYYHTDVKIILKLFWEEGLERIPQNIICPSLQLQNSSGLFAIKEKKKRVNKKFSSMH